VTRAARAFSLIVASLISTEEDGITADGELPIRRSQSRIVNGSPDPLQEIGSPQHAEWAGVGLEKLRLLACAVVHAQDLDGLSDKAIGDDEWRLRDDELTGAGHPAGTTYLRSIGQKLSRAAAVGLSSEMKDLIDARSSIASGDQTMFIRGSFSGLFAFCPPTGILPTL